ncbi:unnamed protein product, partial [Mesorhabditis belari]|uniref:Uncharacterized protein n=1 Tax=Mesorhabditis belari TaxID=2138241 RepID=A0AAF3EGK0_9BILA
MVIPREKEFSPSAFGVYPRPRELPSPVCCFQIMHIRTGAMWIAYGEMMWITSQVSFWAAQAVTGGWNPMTILLGFLTVILQIILVIHLVKGIREFRLSLLLVYMCVKK